MREILPGIWHWTSHHQGIDSMVSSYFVEPAGTLVDPMVPDAGVESFAGRSVDQVVLTNRHHYRHSGRFADEFGCCVRVSEPGLDEFDDDRAVEGFAFGDELAPGIVAMEVGAICPDETALHITAGPGALACADGVIREGGGPLTFVPDQYLGDDPAQVKRDVRAALGGLLDLEFDALLLAHGDPLIEGGREALRRFVERP